MATLPAALDAVNPQPSYYAVIPASVRYCKSLPPAAKLFFGEITALCSVAGYCWASNAYFCGLYDVDRSTLQRWLSALAREGFVRIELIPGTGERRIYDLTIKPTSPPQKSGTPAAKVPPPRRKSAAQSITLSITENNKKELLPRGQQFVGPGPVAARDLARTEAEQKGSASPPTVEANPKKLRQVERAVARCGNLSLRGRFSELWDFVNAAGCPDAWQYGIDAAKTPESRAAGILEPPARRFVIAVAAALASRNVDLPDGLAAPLA